MVLYILGLMFAFVAFCAIFRWQPWNTRLHLPIFVLFAAVIGTTFERRLQKLSINCIAFSLLGLAVPIAVMNWSRPLIGEGSLMRTTREELYFRENPSRLVPYRAVAKRVDSSDCSVVGLDISDGYQYPLLVLLNAQRGDKNIKPVEAQKNPCAVICVDCSEKNRRRYETAVGAGFMFQDVTVFERMPSGVGLSTASHQQSGANDR